MVTERSIVDPDGRWLCDLIPHSCVNDAQREAIERSYMPLVAKYGLPAPTVPSVPQRLTDDERRRAILAELRESGAALLVLLGDQPIKWFLRFYDGRWKTLGDFGRDAESYGRRHPVVIDGLKIEVLPLAHPRQVARLGHSSAAWYGLHRAWVEKTRRNSTTA